MADKEVTFVINLEVNEPKTDTTPSGESRKPTKTKRTIPSGGGVPEDLYDQINFHKTAQGGVLGGPVEPTPIGFRTQARQIRGGVRQSKFRDERSASPIVAEKYYDTLDKIRDDMNKLKRFTGYTKTVKSGTQMAGQVLTDPIGVAQGIGGSLISKISKPTKPGEKQGLMKSLLLGLTGAGPYGAAIVAAITAIMLAPHVIRQLIKVMSQKGLPWNSDWRREIEKEVNGLFNIEDKKRQLLGLDGYITTQTDRYVPESGTISSNSYENRDEIRISTIGNRDKALGIRY